MTFGPSAGGRLIALATPGWCWSRLEEAREGILSYRGPRGATSLAVPFSVRDQQVVIPVGPFNQVGHLALDTEVTLEVIGRTDLALRWVVWVTGVAVRHATGSSGASSATQCRQLHPARGAASEEMDALLLPDVRVRGFYESATRRVE